MKRSKKIISLLLSGVFIFSLVSCGLKDKVKEKIAENDIKEVFSHAINSGNVELFKELCESHPDFDLNSISSSNNILMNLLYTANCPRSVALQMADLALEHGVDVSLISSDDQPYIYNSVSDYVAIGVDNLKYLSDKGIDLKSVDNEILGNLLECCIDNNVNDLNSFEVFDYLMDQGLTVRKEFIEKEDLESKYYKFLQSPYAIKEVVSQYIKDGGELDFPDYFVSALCGDIDKMLVQASKTDIDKESFEVLFTYTQAFGTVEQYKKLLEIYGKEWDEIPNFSAMICCNNTEMLEYFVNDLIALQKSDEYSLRTDCFDVAAYYHYYDIFDVLINNSFDFYDDFLEIPLYGLLGACIRSEDYDLNEFKKLYKYMENNHTPIKEDYAARLFSDRIDLKAAKKYIDFFMDEKGISFYLLGIADVQYDVAEYLYKKGRKLQAYDLSDAIRSQNLELVKLVHKQGADINQLWYNFLDGDEWNRKLKEYPDYTEQLKDTTHPNYTPRPSNFEMNISSVNNEMVKYLIDCGMEIPDNALIYASEGSKAVNKILFDNNANTDIDFSSVKGVMKKDYSLEEYYKSIGRSDLLELL